MPNTTAIPNCLSDDMEGKNLETKEETALSNMDIEHGAFRILHRLHVVRCALIALEEGSLKWEPNEYSILGCKFLVEEVIEEVKKITGEE